MGARSPTGTHRRQQRFQARPLGIGQVGGIARRGMAGSGIIGYRGSSPPSYPLFRHPLRACCKTGGKLASVGTWRGQAARQGKRLRPRPTSYVVGRAASTSRSTSWFGGGDASRRARRPFPVAPARLGAGALDRLRDAGAQRDPATQAMYVWGPANPAACSSRSSRVSVLNRAGGCRALPGPRQRLV